jgi:hypothetical protein
MNTIVLFISGFGDACCEAFRRAEPDVLILAFAVDNDIMHVAAQKHLQRTTIYPADAHEIPLDWLSRLRWRS